MTKKAKQNFSARLTFREPSKVLSRLVCADFLSRSHRVALSALRWHPKMAKKELQKEFFFALNTFFSHIPRASLSDGISMTGLGHFTSDDCEKSHNAANDRSRTVEGNRSSLGYSFCVRLAAHTKIHLRPNVSVVGIVTIGR